MTKLFTYSNTIENSTITATFTDKRTYNSFLKNIEKMEKMTISYNNNNTTEKIISDTPNILDNFSIVEKYDHVVLKPHTKTNKEEISISPDFQYTWSPIIYGQYWNDGNYHFFPLRPQKYFLQNYILSDQRFPFDLPK